MAAVAAVASATTVSLQRVTEDAPSMRGAERRLGRKCKNDQEEQREQNVHSRPIHLG